MYKAPPKVLPFCSQHPLSLQVDSVAMAELEVAADHPVEGHAQSAEDEALSEKHGLVMQIIFKRREVADKKKKLDDKEKYYTRSIGLIIA